VAQFVSMSIWALTFWSGMQDYLLASLDRLHRVASKLVASNQCEVSEVFRAMTTVLFAALMAFVLRACLFSNSVVKWSLHCADTARPASL
jgi:hypothetical protein